MTQKTAQKIKTIVLSIAGGIEVEQLKLAGGYDHFFLLNESDRALKLAAMLYSPKSGIRLNLYADQPGVQLYTGNFLGDPFEPRAALCLEFHDVPNAPNMPQFPSTVLKPGEIYHRQTRLEFECE